MFEVIIDKLGTRVSFQSKVEAEIYIKKHNNQIVDTLFQLELCKNCPIVVGNKIRHNRSIATFLKSRCAFVDLEIQSTAYMTCKNYLNGELNLIPITKIETE